MPSARIFLAFQIIFDHPKYFRVQKKLDVPKKVWPSKKKCFSSLFSYENYVFRCPMPMPSARPNFFSPTKKKKNCQWKVEFHRRKIHFYFIKLIFRWRNFTFHGWILFSPAKIKFRWADGMGISIQFLKKLYLYIDTH